MTHDPTTHADPRGAPAPVSLDLEADGAARWVMRRERQRRNAAMLERGELRTVRSVVEFERLIRCAMALADVQLAAAIDRFVNEGGAVVTS